jgi:hypothetical protein
MGYASAGAIRSQWRSRRATIAACFCLSGLPAHAPLKNTGFALARLRTLTIWSLRESQGDSIAAVGFCRAILANQSVTGSDAVITRHKSQVHSGSGSPIRRARAGQMSWLTNGVVAGAAAVLIAACADRVSSPEGSNTEQVVLAQRIQDLKSRVAPTGHLTPAQMQLLEQLRQDVIAYQGRTGRKDITVMESRPGKTEVSANLAVRGVAPDPGSSTCSCPPIVSSPGRICFLTYASCQPGQLPVCVHICFGTGPAGPPTR